MPIRMRTTVLGSIILLGAICLALEALVVQRVFYLRDLQSALIQDQVAALRLERQLAPYAGVQPQDSRELMRVIDESSLLMRCCERSSGDLKKVLEVFDAANYRQAYALMREEVDASLELQAATIAKARAINSWLPLLIAVAFMLIVFSSWRILQHRFLGPISRLHATVSQAGLRGPLPFEAKNEDPKEVAELAASFVSLLGRLDSELKGREIALREANDMVRRETQRISGELSQMFADSPLPIFGTDLAGTVTTWNGKIAAITNIPASEAKGAHFVEFALSGPDKITFEKQFRTVLQGNSVDELQLTLLGRGDVSIVINAHMVPRRSYGGEIVGINCFGHEIESVLEEAALAVEAQRTTHFSELASSAAHQLNQPLQKMRLYLANAQNRLRVPTLDKEILVEKLRGIDEQLSRVSEIIEHLREFGRPIEPLKDGFQVGTVIERCLELSRGNLIERGIRVSLDCSLTDQLANGHPLQIEKPLIALLNNAQEAVIEAAPARAEIKVAVVLMDQGRAKVTVSDNGLGVTTELKKRIFEPFFSTRDEGKNVGLGLPVARAMIEDLGGRITLDREGDWTVATMVIPLREESLQEAAS